MRPFLIITALLVASCASVSTRPSSDWVDYQFDLSGRKFSFSAPPGDFPVVYRAVASPSEGAEKVRLFNSAWIFKGPIKNKGALELFVSLHAAKGTAAEASLRRAVQERLASEAAKLNVRVPGLSETQVRTFGGRAWLCYSLPVVHEQECSLSVDDQQYISWSFHQIDNSTGRVVERDELMASIERTLRIDF
jgi:hypothetical protein